LEDWIGEDNPVRVIDVFVEGSIWPISGSAGLILRQPADLRINRRWATGNGFFSGEPLARCGGCGRVCVQLKGNPLRSGSPSI
jgi:hypothetical protein